MKRALSTLLRLVLPAVAATLGCDVLTGPGRPDARPLAYMKLDGPFGWSVFQVSARSGAPESIDVGARSGLFPALSPDGTRLAFLSETAPGGVFVADRNGSNADVVFSNAAVAHIAWSPDGTRLLLSFDGEIAVVGADGNGFHTITASIDEPVSNASWSRLGIIAVTGPGGIYRMKPDGSDFRLLVDGEGLEARDPAWSPDGLRLAFALGIYGASTIFTVNTSGGDRRAVTSPPAADGLIQTDLGPVWSPSGQWIAFQREALACVASCEPRWDIFVVGRDGNSLRNVTQGSPWGGVRPTW